MVVFGGTVGMFDISHLIKMVVVFDDDGDIKVLDFDV